jgi:hypothetical protein
MTLFESVRSALKHYGDRVESRLIAGVLTVEPHDLVGYVSRMPASVDVTKAYEEIVIGVRAGNPAR